MALLSTIALHYTMPLLNPDTTHDWSKIASEYKINIDNKESAAANYMMLVFMHLPHGKVVTYKDIYYFCRYHGFNTGSRTDPMSNSNIRGYISGWSKTYDEVQAEAVNPIKGTCAFDKCKFTHTPKGDKLPENELTHHRFCTLGARKNVSASMPPTMHQKTYGTDPSLDKRSEDFDTIVTMMKKLAKDAQDAEDATSVVAPVSLKRSRDDENLSALIIQAKRPRIDTTFDFAAQSVVPTNIAVARTTQAPLTDDEIASLLSFINPITTSDDTVSTPYNFDALLGINTTSDNTVSTSNFDIDLDTLLGITNTTSDNTVPTPYKFDIDALRGSTNTTSDNTVPTPSTFAFDWLTLVESTPVEISAPVIPDALAFFKL